MKHQLAIAALTLGLTASALATPTPGEDAGTTGAGAVYRYDFDYIASNPSVAPSFATTVTNVTAGVVEVNDALAYTIFNAPPNTASVYNLTASYSAHPEEYQSYFSTGNAAGNAGNTTVTSVGANDPVHIVLAARSRTLSAGTTHVTYTINSFAS